MLLLVLIFIVLPIAELWVIIKVGGAIGVLPTLAILIADSFIGAAIARSQGRQAWRRFNQALAEGRIPTREVFDGAMVILGGAFLLTPGFITDAIGLVLLLPPTRALMRTFITRVARRRVAFGWRTVRYPPPGPTAERRPGAYDYEGTAHEVTEPPAELLPPEPDER